LEQHGFDYMSEDYAAPNLKRRAPPERRQEPERHEGGAARLLVRPKKAEPSKKSGRQPGPIAEFILQVVNEAGVLSTDEIIELAKDRGWPAKKVRDTLRRLKTAEKITDNARGAGWRWIMRGSSNG
jgi:hypothetical protein